MNADRAKAKDQKPKTYVKQFNDSTIQRFNSFFALSALIRLYLRPIKPLLLFATGVLFRIQRLCDKRNLRAANLPAGQPLVST
jgi:hypothetical protein